MEPLQLFNPKMPDDFLIGRYFYDIVVIGDASIDEPADQVINGSIFLSFHQLLDKHST